MDKELHANDWDCGERGRETARDESHHRHYHRLVRLQLNVVLAANAAPNMYTTAVVPTTEFVFLLCLHSQYIRRTADLHRSLCV